LRHAFEHPTRVTSLGFSPEGQWLATGALDGTIRLWTLEDGRQMPLTLSLPTCAQSLEFSPDGRWLVAFTDTIHAWQVGVWEEARIFPIHAVEKALSPAGSWLALRCKDGAIHLWKLGDWQGPRLLPGGANSHGLTFSSDGRWLASSPFDGTINLWQVESGRLNTLRGPESALGELKFGEIVFSDDSRLLAANSYGHVVLWDIETSLELRGEFRSGGNTTRLSQDGRWLATGYVDEEKVSASLWEVKTGTQLSLSDDSFDLDHEALTPDDREPVSEFWRATIRAWEAETKRRKMTLWHGDDLELSQDSRWAASGIGTEAVLLWVNSGATRYLLPERKEMEGCWTGQGSWTVKFSPDGRWLASGFGPTRLFDLESGRLVVSPELAQCSITSAAFSPDSACLAASRWDGEIWLRNLKTSQEEVLRGPERSEGSFNSMAFNQDGSFLATVADDGSIWLWKKPRFARYLRLDGPQTPAWSLAFSPDNRWLAAGYQDGVIRLWSIPTGWREGLSGLLGYPSKVLSGHENGVRSVAFSPDSRWLASGADDQTVRVWDPEAGQEIQAFGGQAASVEFSQNGSRLIVGGYEKTTLWDLATGASQRVSERPHSALCSPETHPWLPLWRDNETILWSRSSQSEVAHLPLSLKPLETSPYDSRLLLGKCGLYFALYALEGD
jgi:WD40 repeat protein